MIAAPGDHRVDGDGAAAAVLTPLRRDEVLERLAAGVAEVRSSEAWQRWLDTARTLPSYSFNNLLLLSMQLHGESAGPVAGYRAWQRLGRQVRAGERALWVIAPMRRRTVVTEPDEEGEPRGVLVERITGWKPVPVFAASQTTGAALPEPPCRRLEGDAPAVAEQLLAFAAELGYTVDRAPFSDPHKNGETAPLERRILIRDDISDLMALKVLCHELGHVLLHVDDGRLLSLPREVRELEAESVAYVCLGALHVDTGIYSFGYLLSWTQAEDTAQLIRQSGERILRASRRILDRLAAPAIAAHIVAV